MTLTSITSYTDRDILVVRDASALTSSITGGSIGLPENVYTLNSPLDDKTKAKVLTQELRLSGSGNDKLEWVAARFYSTNEARLRPETCWSPGSRTLTGIPTAGNFGAAQGRPVLLRPATTSSTSSRSSARRPMQSPTASTSPAACATTTSTRTGRRSSTASSRTRHEQARHDVNANGVAPRAHRQLQGRATSTELNAQVSKGFRLGGINDPLNVPCARRRTSRRSAARTPGRTRRPGTTRSAPSRRSWAAAARSTSSAFYMDISDLQATVTAGSCSSRVIFNVPKARSTGVEVEFAAAPNEHFDFAISASYNNSELALHPDLDRLERQGQRRGRHREGQSPAERAQVPDVGGGHLSVADVAATRSAT